MIHPLDHPDMGVAILTIIGKKPVLDHPWVIQMIHRVIHLFATLHTGLSPFGSVDHPL